MSIITSTIAKMAHPIGAQVLARNRQPLLDFIRTISPNLVAISDDLTQPARTREFQRARRFLRSIPFPQIVVPGNQDVPLQNLFSRFLGKLDRYRYFISDELEPFYHDPGAKDQELRIPDCIVRRKYIDARARPAEFTERNSNQRRKDHNRAANVASGTMRL
jgi:3',5'-cyclic AMP phosphodiesterase CpdA